MLSASAITICRAKKCTPARIGSFGLRRFHHQLAPTARKITKCSQRETFRVSPPVVVLKRQCTTDSKTFHTNPPKLPGRDHTIAPSTPIGIKSSRRPKSAHLSQDARKAHSALETHGSEHHGGYAGAKHQLRHRATEKIGMKIAEKTTAKVLPRLFARLQKRIGMKILFRKLLRGVAIALPAIGGIFASVVTFYDARRALREKNHGNRNAAALFGIAAVWDVVDVAAHAVTTLALSGLVPHAHEHTSETVSLVAAVIATGAAIVGEIVSVKASVAAEEAAGEDADDNKPIERPYTQPLDGIICSPEGVLTGKAISALALIFKAHDLNNDGHLDRHELAKYIASCTGKTPHADELDYLMSNFQSGSDGLTETGFFAMYSTQTLQNPAQTWRDLRAHGYNDNLTSGDFEFLSSSTPKIQFQVASCSFNPLDSGIEA